MKYDVYVHATLYHIKAKDVYTFFLKGRDVLVKLFKTQYAFITMTYTAILNTHAQHTAQKKRIIKENN